MKRNLLFVSAFIGSFAFGQDCSELFISEYVEGWSNNKSLEIYNPTNNSIDLSQYMVIRYSNGATSATAANAVQLTGTIGAKDVYVATIDKRDPMGSGQEAPVWDDLQAVTDGFYCPDYNTSNAFYWNGNDAVVLAKGTTSDINNSILVDVFGKIGEDPNDGNVNGWTSDFPYVSTGDVVTQDHSMIRKPDVMVGQTNPTISYFNPLGEWDSIPPVIDVMGTLEGNWGSLGQHTCDCNSLNVEETTFTPEVMIFPNPTSGNFTIGNVAGYEKIEIVNALGQSFKTIKNPTNIVNVSLNGYKGLYLVNLIAADGEKLTRRVILK
jgi:hypothetical protein